jgi:hypothetical protein
MPIPWLTVLQSVPWSDVISNAPKVADSAKKLWQSVARKPAAKTPPLDRVDAPPGAPIDLPALLARQARLEAQVAELHSQMAASSELITTLAEQNTQLIARLELQRQRLRRLAGLTAVVALVMAWLAYAALR